MGKSSEQRRFARFILPVVIDAPDLSDLPIVPEDISAGGFKVMITKEPPNHNPLSCSLHVSGEFFGNCQVKVAWTKKTHSVPASWQVGLAIENLNADQNKLVQALDEVRTLLAKK